MAWLVFGTFFLIDAHAPWPWYVVWGLAAGFDYAKEKQATAAEAMWRRRVIHWLS